MVNNHNLFPNFGSKGMIQARFNIFKHQLQQPKRYTKVATYVLSNSRMKMQETLLIASRKGESY